MGNTGSALGRDPCYSKKIDEKFYQMIGKILLSAKISQAPPSQILHVVDRTSPIYFWVTCKDIQCTDQNVLAATFYVAGSSVDE